MNVLVLHALFCLWTISQQAATIPPRAITGVAHLDKTPALVGSSGQIYQPAPNNPQAWQSVAPGGVATHVKAAVANPVAGVYAIGSRTPLFVRRNQLWSVVRLRHRGPIAVSTANQSIISVGKHAYALGQEGWKRFAGTQKNVTAFWALDEKTFYSGNRSGSIVRVRGSRRIKLTQLRDDHVVQFWGATSQFLLAATFKGKWLRVDSTRTRPLRVPALGVSFRVHTALAEKKQIWVLGTTDENQTMLFSVGAKGANRVDVTGIELSEGDRFAAVMRINSTLTAASTRGEIWQREAEQWHKKSLLPAERTPNHNRPPPGSQPARVGRPN